MGKEKVVEFKGIGIPFGEQVDGLDELVEDGSKVIGRGGWEVRVTRGEAMARQQPILLNECKEPFERAEVGVEDELRQGGELGRAVPSIRTVDQHKGMKLI